MKNLIIILSLFLSSSGYSQCEYSKAESDTRIMTGTDLKVLSDDLAVKAATIFYKSEQYTVHLLQFYSSSRVEEGTEIRLDDLIFRANNSGNYFDINILKSEFEVLKSKNIRKISIQSRVIEVTNQGIQEALNCIEMS